MNKNKKQTIIIEKSDNGISKIILNQPEKHNALSPMMIKELSESFDELKEDPNTIVLIISAKGKSFCAGGDLDWMKEQIFSDRKTRIEEARKLADLLLSMGYETNLNITKIKECNKIALNLKEHGSYE